MMELINKKSLIPVKLKYANVEKMHKDISYFVTNAERIG